MKEDEEGLQGTVHGGIDGRGTLTRNTSGPNSFSTRF